MATSFTRTHSLSHIDLSISSTSLDDCFECNILDDRYTSDHFPVVIFYLQDNPHQCIHISPLMKRKIIMNSLFYKVHY